MSDTQQAPGWWLASDGKWYPPQTPAPPYAPAPKKRGRGCLIAVLAAVVVLILLIVVVLAASGGSKKASTSVTTSKPATGGTFAVGQTASSSGFEIVVFGVKDPQPPSQFARPAAGTHYISVDVQLTNKNSRQEVFSSIIGFHLLDAKNQQYDVQFTDITPKSPEGEFAPGQALRGLVVFQVPDGSTGLRVRVQGSITATGAVFKLT